MTKLIAIFVIVLVLFGGWQFFLYWERVKNEDESKRKQEVAATVSCDQLPGVPDKLVASLQNASKSASQYDGRALKVGRGYRGSRGTCPESGERRFEIRPCRWTGGKLTVWPPNKPGEGEPLFRKSHMARQRRAVGQP